MKIVVSFLWFILITLWVSTPALAANKVQPDGTCPLAIFIPFHDDRSSPYPDAYYGFGTWSSEAALGKASFSLLAAAQMAKDHFNQRNASVVPAMKDYQTCNVTFPNINWSFLDSRYSRSKVVDSLIQIRLNTSNPDICAVIGPTDPRANEGASVITENLNVPQIAYQTIDRRLERKQDFPTFVRGIPAAPHIAESMAFFLQGDVWKRDFVGVIYDQSDYGEQFEDPLEDFEEDLGYLTITEHVVETDEDSKNSAFGEAIQKGFHTVTFISDKTYILPEVAVKVDGNIKVEDDDGVETVNTLVGDKFAWLLTGDIAPPEFFDKMRYEVDDPMDKLLRGAALITNHDPFIYEPEGDAFLNAWKSQTDEMLNRLRSMHPLDPTDDAFYVGEPGYFQREMPAEYASFLYDAILNAGMAACRSEENGSDHIAEVVKSDFEGASGRTVFIEDTHSRDPVGVKFGIYNVRPGEVDQATNKRGYTRHLVATWDGAERKWVKVPGEEFIFFDGTSNEPSPVRETIDFNYLSPEVQTVGFVLVGVSLFFILFSAIWVFVRRKQRIVTTAQPEFLYLLCLGAAIQAVSLIFVSFDESYGWTESGLSLACSMFPWFFVIGYLVQYCATFSKLWRLSKLLSMRRRAVRFSQVMLPFGLIITASISILIVWQLLDPLTWHRELLGGYLEEDPWESYGQCAVSGVVGGTDYSDIGALPYIIPLILLFLIVMFMTLSISWKMRSVQSDLSEAKWIFIAVFSHIQIWLVGIPVFVIVNQISRDAAYLIQMALIIVFSTVFVALIIGPKMLTDVRENVLGKKPKTSNPTRISTIGGSTRVSGLEHHPSQGPTSSSNMPTSDADQLRIATLQAEVSTLKSQLARSNSAVSRSQRTTSVSTQSLDEESSSRKSPISTSSRRSVRMDSAGQLNE